MDGLTFRDYQKELDRNLQNLWETSGVEGTAHCPYIPKEDGKSERPISIPALEDKIVQAASRDAREGRRVYLWSLVTDPAQHGYLLASGW